MKITIYFLKIYKYFLIMLQTIQYYMLYMHTMAIYDVLYVCSGIILYVVHIQLHYIRCIHTVHSIICCTYRVAHTHTYIHIPCYNITCCYTQQHYIICCIYTVVLYYMMYISVPLYYMLYI